MPDASRRYIVDPGGTDGDDGLFPQIYHVDGAPAGSMTLSEAKREITEYVLGWVDRWRDIGEGRPGAAEMPTVSADDAPEEIAHWESIGCFWAGIAECDIEPRP